jgi:hypothetical protein
MANNYAHRNFEVTLTLTDGETVNTETKTETELEQAVREYREAKLRSDQSYIKFAALEKAQSAALDEYHAEQGKQSDARAKLMRVIDVGIRFDTAKNGNHCI